jgi:hypothetical protein
VHSLLCTGHITGGSLRTLDQADSETMQADWWPADIDKSPKGGPPPSWGHALSDRRRETVV